MKSQFLRHGLALVCVVVLGACSGFNSDNKKPLPGERISVLDLQKHIEPDNPVLNAEGFVAPPSWRNDFWPQAGGYPNHAMQHLALNEAPLKKMWSVDIGAGASDTLPLTAQPIVVEGRIFTVDTEDVLSAFSISDGKRLWQTHIGPEKKREQVIGGGIAFSDGKIYATNGGTGVMAVSPEDGKIVWRVNVPSPSRAAPTVVNDRLFIATLDNHLYTLSTADGSILWDFAGVTETAGLVGAASPAASTDVVIPAFSSGEIFALRAENGTIAWSENLASTGLSGGLTGLSSIRGLPVLDKGQVFAVSFAGRFIALEERTGSRLWQREIGSAVSPWLAGNHVFVVSTDNELVSLGRDDGTISWVRPLERFRKGSHKDPLYWTSPILAGGRLLVAGTRGDLVEVDPVNGKVIRTTSLGKSVTIDPVVAGGVLYLLADDGTLMAFQ
ncbi:MAG TPA: PQQ-binding-like beta-propeller repeat protein [Patescibacteria group bacterium]|nr:PQQ-binding-like beta-propeller repeat protein [Patescibacteria group bacterium]